MMTANDRSLQTNRARLAKYFGLAVIGSCLLTLSSYLAVPMVPVPITMQTLAVTVIGALYGWRLGFATIVFWLIQGAMGLPVFAGGASGPAVFLGFSAGYLIAFPLAAAATGWLTQIGWGRGRPMMAFLSMLIGNAICLIVGTAWLSTFIGAEAAFLSGFAPFIPGAIIKSVMGVGCLYLAYHFTRAKRSNL
ncbi:MAG: biotin transporter BioY [Pseudomonadota bacterium]